MASSILNVGQSGLQAAQVGLTTTGHNIANASTPGYSRQVVIQAAAGAQDFGFGFVGRGTEVSTVRRVYSEFLNTQVMNAQTSKTSLDSYSAQIAQIDNMLADSTSGVPASLQDFFSGVQDLASNPNSDPSRQSMLSSAQTLAGRFQTMGSQLDEIRQGVNDQISTSVTTINGYATQIAQLNDAIEKAQGTSGDSKPANDLLDQRDQLVSELSKEVRVSVVKQGNSYNVFIGNGQPLIVGNQTFQMAATLSSTDPNRVEVGFNSNGVVTALPESAFTGGSLGGLMDFRAQSLDPAQNALGRVAIGLAMTFNAQHELGQDQNGNLGQAFFKVGAPVVNANSANAGDGKLGATISDASQLTTSDYMVQVVSASPASYKITQLSDGASSTFSSLPQSWKGIDFSLTSGTPASGDSFLVKPTTAGAVGFDVAVTDTSKIAAAAPITTSFTAGSKIVTSFTPATPPSTATIGGAAASASFTTATLTPAVTLTYDAGTTTLSGFPTGVPVTVTSGGVTTSYAAGTPVPYTSGSTISFGGASFVITGPLVAGDKFTIGNAPAGTGKITAPVVNSTTAIPSLSLTYAAGNLTGFPSQMPVTVTSGGVTTTYAAGAPVPYVAGDTVAFGGVQVSGIPAAAGSYTVSPSATVTYDSTTNTLTNFPSYLDVSVNHNGTNTTYAAGTAVPYSEGDTISVGGVSFSISGILTNGDQFAIAANTNGKGDNRNALLLGALQTANTLANGTASYQSAYGQLVSQVGNKAHELSVTSAAEGKLLDSAVAAQQSESGVNLDEEATNLLRYQQAYQAAGKVIQTASQLFDFLLTIGH
jgi:flagellar hook-associated protein 1 FlgK